MEDKRFPGVGYKRTVTKAQFLGLYLLNSYVNLQKTPAWPGRHPEGGGLRPPLGLGMVSRKMEGRGL